MVWELRTHEVHRLSMAEGNTEEGKTKNKSRHSGHTNEVDQLGYSRGREHKQEPDHVGVKAVEIDGPSNRDLRHTDIEPALAQDLTSAN